MVEDNSADVFLLRYALDAHGEDYRLEVLRDSEQAIEFVQMQRTAGAAAEPCVIVLDLHLPKHSGAAVLKAIREEPVLAHVHVIALSTLASPRDEQELRELNVRAFVPGQADASGRLGQAGGRDHRDLQREQPGGGVGCASYRSHH